MHTFDSAYRIGKRFSGNDEFTPIDVKNEPMFFNSSLAYAYNEGGSITREFINAFSHDFAIKSGIDPADFVFDSRVHMLMKGWFPCIPGFHHDDVPRHTSNGQPNYTDPEYRSQHCMGLVNGEICPTEFAIGTAEFSEIGEDQVAYEVWHKEVEQRLMEGTSLVLHDAPSNKLVYFDDRTWHQGTRAIAGGWRWFGRISWNTARVNNITNEIRRQVQVYLENPMQGW
jgi:hypothetical protein